MEHTEVSFERILIDHCQQFITINASTFYINDVYCKDGIAFDNWVVISFDGIKAIRDFLGY